MCAKPQSVPKFFIPVTMGRGNQNVGDGGGVKIGGFNNLVCNLYDCSDLNLYDSINIFTQKQGFMVFTYS